MKISDPLGKVYQHTMFRKNKGGAGGSYDVKVRGCSTVALPLLPAVAHFPRFVWGDTEHFLRAHFLCGTFGKCSACQWVVTAAALLHSWYNRNFLLMEP